MLEKDNSHLLHRGTTELCSLLGLRHDFLDSLDEIPPEHRDHFTLCDWIVTFLGNNYESISFPDKESPSKGLLSAIGFDPLSSAVETIMARAERTQHHIEACEMAEIFIRDEFKYNPRLYPLAERFPFQNTNFLTDIWFQLPSTTNEKGEETNEDLCHVNIVNLVTKESHATTHSMFSDVLSDLKNSWFQLPPSTTDEKGQKSNEDLCQVSIMNVVTKESYATTQVQSMFSDLVSEDEQNVVLFHGTDHQSASDILFRGIDLCAGRQKRDFSCGSGFYLTDNFDEALNWANNTTEKPAMLIFQVNRREHLDDSRKLNLYENEEKWLEIVSSFRSGKRTAKTRKSLSEYDLIEGPAATITRNESGELMIEPKPSSYQMCLISDEFADKFRETLHSIVLF